jgi:chromate reductase, NAD(P)H dehydrogenase (quinone)
LQAAASLTSTRSKKGELMSQINIAVIVGSLRRDSFNAKLARAIAKLAPGDFTFKHSQIGDLPLYN